MNQNGNEEVNVLRFVIGIFFLTAGVLSLGYAFLNSAGATINTWCGILYVVFGGGCLGVTRRGVNFKFQISDFRLTNYFW